MRKLILADINRILRKKTVILLYLIILLYILINMGVKHILYPESEVGISELIRKLNIFSIVTSIVVFFAVYADDFKSACYVIAIGRGISRTKVIVAKLLDVTIVLGVMYAILVLLGSLEFLALGMVFDHTLAGVWFGSAFISFYKTVGYIALASMVLYITNNIPLSLISLVTLLVMVPNSTLLLALNETIRKSHIDRLHYAGLADNALTDFLFGSAGMAVLKLVLGFTIYFGGVLLVTTALFEKKEIDF